MDRHALVYNKSRGGLAPGWCADSRISGVNIPASTFADPFISRNVTPSSPPRLLRPSHVFDSFFACSRPQHLLWPSRASQKLVLLCRRRQVPPKATAQALVAPPLAGMARSERAQSASTFMTVITAIRTMYILIAQLFWLWLVDTICGQSVGDVLFICLFAFHAI